MEKEKKSKKILIISLIIGFFIVLGTMITIMLIINNTDYDPKSSNESDVPKNKRKEFIDIALLYAKAAENAYVDNGDIGTKSYTIDYLYENYISGKYSDKGCIVIKADNNGNITDKIIYLTNYKYMIINTTSNDIVDDNYKVKKYDDSWNLDYEECKLEYNEVAEAKEANETDDNNIKENNRNSESKSSRIDNNSDKNTAQKSNSEIQKDASSTNSASNVSVGKQNALKTAKTYLKYSSFSYKGLIEQLEYEKYTNEEATYAVDNCGANWNEQALKTAKSYLSSSSFSYKGLIEQLEYEKFTSSEAKYGVDNCGADWNEQAVKTAKSYLKYSSFSREGLIEQLEYEGFTHSQAVYGVDQTGL